MQFDTLERHLQACDDIGQATIPMGMMLAWCVNMHLLAPEFQQEFDREILRVRMRELRGSELLVAAGGNLDSAMFSAAGQAFLTDYYPRYLDDMQRALGELYGLKDDWDTYGAMAKVVTAHYMRTTSNERSSPTLSLKWLKLPNLRQWFSK